MLCEHFGRCGGCTYLDIPYEQELEIKRAALVECLGENGHLVGKLHPAPRTSAYRNKMELAFGDEGKDGRLALGMRKKRSFYEVATPTDCVLIPADFKIIVQYVLDFFRESGEDFFHRKRHTGSLRHLVLRRGEFTGEILVMLSAASTLQTPLEPFVQGLLALPLQGEIVGILHAANDGVADAVKNENITLLHGRDYYNERLCGLKFRVSMFSFFQTNSRGAEVLYGIVKGFSELCPEPYSLFEKSEAKTLTCALDLYCGTGTIAQIVSPLFERVIGVEIVEDAILAAKENAAQNGITNCEFHAADTLHFLSSNIQPLTPNLCLLDPPRDGLHPKALPLIAALGAPAIIYVACKPKSLARDLPILAQNGYFPTKIEAADLFPRTPHLEAVCLLTAQK